MTNKNRINAKIERKLYSIFFRKQKYNLIFISLFSLIMISIILIFGSTLFSNLDNSIVKTIDDKHYEYIRFKGDKSDINENNIEMPMIINDYSIDINNTIIKDPEVQNLSVYDMPALFASSNIVELTNDNSLKLVKGAMPSTISEIAITDYMAQFFIKFGLKDNSAVNSLDDLLGKVLSIEKNSSYMMEYRTQLKIVGIIETNLSDYADLNDMDIKAVNFDLSELLRDPYSIINNVSAFDITTQSDQRIAMFSQSALFEYMNMYVIQDFQQNSYSNFDQAYLQVDDTNLIVAKDYDNILDKNEIVLPLSRFMSQENYNDTIKQYENYELFFNEVVTKLSVIGNNIAVKDLLGKSSMGAPVTTESYNKSFVVGSIVDDFKYPNLKAKICAEEFDKILKITANQNAMSKNIDGYITVDSNSKAFIKNNMSSIFFPEKQLINSGYDSIAPFSAILMAISILFCILIIGFMVYSIVNLCKLQQKNMALLKMQGYSNITIVKIILVPLLMIFGIAFVLSAAIGAISLFVLNSILTFNMGITLYYISYIPIIIVLGVLIVSISLGAIIGAHKIKHTSPTILLKD